MVDAVINLAHALGLQVVAEGVETAPAGDPGAMRLRRAAGLLLRPADAAAELEQRLRQIAERRSAIPTDGGARIDRPVLASATD